MRRENRKDDAVSPVIGVMLMLVVTVVIAAVVVGFSTGLAGSSSTTPTALYEVSDVETWVDPTIGVGEVAYLNIRQKGGDSVPLNELQITLETVGGENNGLTRTIIATDDAEGSFDGTAGSFEAPSQDVVDAYENAKKTYLAMKGTLPPGMSPEAIEGICGSELKNYENDWGVVFSDPDDRTSGSLVGKKSSGANTYPMSVLGQGKPTESVVSTGDIIHIVPFDGSDLDTRIFEGTSVKWTISYIPTNSVIAKGEFEVIAD